MAQGESDPGYIATSALNSTIYTSLASGIAVLGGAALGLAKAVGADIPEAVAIAAMAVVGVGLLAIAIVVSADIRARAAIKVATLEHPLGARVQGARQQAGGGSTPLVEVNVRRDGTDVEEHKPGISGA